MKIIGYIKFSIIILFTLHLKKSQNMIIKKYIYVYIKYKYFELMIYF